jgi:hypothetical protein
MFVRLIGWCCLCAFLLIAAGWGLFRFEVTSFQVAFLVLALGLIASMIVWIVALIALMVGKIQRRPVQGSLSWVAVLACLPTVFVLSLIGEQGFSAPLIHDISTDTKHPPAYHWALRERQRGENSLVYAGGGIAQKQREAYPDIQTLVVTAPLVAVEKVINDLIDNNGWELLGVTDNPSQIEAVARTPVMGFEDDIVFRLVDNNGVILVDIRSASRLGEGDLGANARRIRAVSTDIRRHFQKD